MNWASHIDLATGRPVLTDVYKRFLAGEEVEIWPSRGTNAVPIAFNPNTGLIYASTWNLPRIQKLAVRRKPQVLGASSTGVTSQAAGGQAGRRRRTLRRDQSADRREEVGGPADRFPELGGMLATGGGLVFTGKLTGEFIALDEDTGKTLWQFKTGSSDQLHRDHLHAQGPAIRHHRVGTRRRARQPLRAGQGANRRIDLDVRADAVIADHDASRHCGGGASSGPTLK